MAFLSLFCLFRLDKDVPACYARHTKSQCAIGKVLLPTKREGDSPDRPAAKAVVSEVPHDHHPVPQDRGSWLGADNLRQRPA